MTCTLWSPWVSTQMGGITGGYKTLILSTQVKQGKVHRSDSPHCNPTQSTSEILPVFSLQCFHRNGWTPSGVRNFNPFLSVLYKCTCNWFFQKLFFLFITICHLHVAWDIIQIEVMFCSVLLGAVFGNIAKRNFFQKFKEILSWPKR